MFKYGIDKLTVSKVMAIAAGTLQTGLDTDVIERVNICRKSVENMAHSAKAIYGINTGFGALCDTQISPQETSKLQNNLLKSHAVGVGPSISKLLSKIMLICKVHALCQGFSGIRLEVIEQILLFIELDLLPVVPAQGSVGASGDLAPLAHLFLPLLGEGYFWKKDKIITAKEGLAKYNLKPIELEAKEGLALINGTQFILAHAVVGLYKMDYLLDLADVAGAMSLEGWQGSAKPFKKELHALRPFTGNLKVAEHIYSLLENSTNMAAHANCGRVQDPYSIRCMPQVHGASRNAWIHLNQMIEIELNSVTDNPIILNAEMAVSGGHFHGQPLAMTIDYCTVAASELGNISDRRCYLLLEGKQGLPRLLMQNSGLNSGFMMLQCTTAALVSENKVLCFPASADSIPTSLGQEDFVSMGSISGRKFNQILDNVAKIIAIELIYASQALEFRRPNRFSNKIEAVLHFIRQHILMIKEDKILKDDLDIMVSLVSTRAFEGLL